MLKKRVIFVLLLEETNFVLSRNFRLQSFGNLKWLMETYNFSKIAFSIDEIIIIDVSRNNRSLSLFCEHIQEINKTCFIPITAGGGIREYDHAKKILSSGADKVILNTLLYKNPKQVSKIAESFGSQSIVASIDTKKKKNNYAIYINNGEMEIEKNLTQWIEYVSTFPVGEIYINSIDNDGTGNGYKLEILDYVPANNNLPIIISGGAGNYKHFNDGLNHDKVDAVATANLFNFVGDGLINARLHLISLGHKLAQWRKL